jgi:hypothetical protein
MNCIDQGWLDDGGARADNLPSDLWGSRLMPQPTSAINRAGVRDQEPGASLALVEVLLTILQTGERYTLHTTVSCVVCIFPLIRIKMEFQEQWYIF